MPKYTRDMIAGYYLYFTDKYIIEAMHVHASNKRLTEGGSAKLFVYSNGDSKIENWGTVKPHEMTKIQKYIKKNYMVMYQKWSQDSENGFYNKR